MDFEKEKLLNEGYTLDQITEIEAGIKQGLDVSVYMDQNFFALQMRQIRFGLEEGLDVTAYADERYDWFQMEEIRKGLLTKLPTEQYADPDIPYDKMKQIRLGLCANIELAQFKHLDAGILKELRLALEHNVKIVSYIYEGYDEEQLAAIREALEKNILIEPYLDIRFRGIAIREISLGLEHDVDVTCYVNPRYYWQQMREIRLGLEHQIDVSKYTDRYYTFEQMREIRLGLEDGLDVSYFSSLMNTASDMRRKRLALLEHPSLAACVETEKTDDTAQDAIQIYLDEEMTKAYVDVRGVPSSRLRIEMLRAIRKKGISVGVRYDTIDRMVESGRDFSHVLIACGELPQDGTDGYYEYFFRTHVSRSPKQEADGSVDYSNVDWFEMVERGQKLAVYHPATEGKSGITVTGQTIPARRGKEQCILTGKGFHRLDDHLTYVSDLQGVITYEDKKNDAGEISAIRIEVTNLLVVEEVTLATGNLHFEGNVHVKGNVGSGVGVFARGDVLIGGFVESAMIQAGGNVMIKQGMNAVGEGSVKALGNVSGLFFESVHIEAGGNIYADYFMGCNLYAEKKIFALGDKGWLVGGSTTAYEGVLAKQIGNRAGIPTLVILGNGHQMRKELENITERAANAQSELVTLIRAKSDFAQKFSLQICNASPMYIKISNAIYTIEQELNTLALQKSMLEEKLQKENTVSANIDEVLHENVTFEIDRVRWKTSKAYANVRIKKMDETIGVFHNL